MRARRFAAWGFLVLFVALGIGAWLGDRLLFALYLVLIVPAIATHVFVLCRRCTNVSCAFNPKSSAFVFGRGRPGDPSCQGFSDLDVKWSAAWISVAGAIAWMATWSWRPIAAILLAGAMVPVHLLYFRSTCSRCTNRCFGNRNPAYHEWKRSLGG